MSQERKLTSFEEKCEHFSEKIKSMKEYDEK